jgi:hypothetical protein
MLKPPPPLDIEEDTFHEVWWNSVAGGDAPKGKLRVQLHQIWMWRGGASPPYWATPDGGDASPADVYEDGWRWVRKVEMTDNFRMDGEPPKV